MLCASIRKRWWKSCETPAERFCLAALACAYSERAALAASAPILLRLTCDGRRGRILDLQPMPRAARTVQ
jgi:hypothetical protein